MASETEGRSFVSIGNKPQDFFSSLLGDKARAYPIRSISYHHVVNDRLGGVPIAATY